MAKIYTLNCPNCGAPVQPNQSECGFCESPLVILGATNASDANETTEKIWFASEAVHYHAGDLGKATYETGRVVEVSWGGSWYPAVIRRVVRGVKYKIHYVNWSTDWDEIVAPDRMRPLGFAEGQMVLASVQSVWHLGYIQKHQPPDMYLVMLEKQALRLPVEQLRHPIYHRGDWIEVKWGWHWYTATVRQVDGFVYWVHYRGWGDTWDEWVMSHRMRT